MEAAPNPQKRHAVEPAPGITGSGVSFRSLLVGLLLTFCISTGAPYSNMVLRGFYLAIDFSTAGAIFLFFVFVLFAHTGLKLLRTRYRLHLAPPR
jgi:hypothetical protein